MISERDCKKIDLAVSTRPLTRREMQTLELMAEGLSNKLIADRLNVTGHTAKFFVNCVVDKLCPKTSRSRTLAVANGLRRGLIS